MTTVTDKRIRCNLCKRKFDSVAKLRRHELYSDLHRTNIELRKARLLAETCAKVAVKEELPENVESKSVVKLEPNEQDQLGECMS